MDVRNKSVLIAVSCFVLFNSLVYSLAEATTYFVDDVATNGNGTSSNPFNNIQSALNAAIAGDTVFIRAGTYTGTWNTVRHGTATARITIDGESKNTTIINGGGIFSNAGLTVKHNYINVARITFRNHFVHGLKVIGHAADSNVTTYIKSVFVSDCDFSNNGVGGGWAHGLYMKNVDDGFVSSVFCSNNFTTGCTLVNCKFSRVTTSRFDSNRGQTTSEGIVFSNCRDSSIEACTANFNSESGFDLSIWEGVPADLKRCTIEYCDARENDGEGFAVSGTTTGSQVASDITIRRSFSGHNNDSGIVVYENAFNVSIINCASVFNDNRGVSNYGNASGILLRNCVFYKNFASTNGPFEDAGGSAAAYIADYNNWSNLPSWMNSLHGTHDVVASNPGFVNEFNGDFELVATSPLINKGLITSGITYLGIAPDLGAYEKQ